MFIAKLSWIFLGMISISATSQNWKKRKTLALVPDFLLKEVKSTFAYYVFSSSIQDKLTYVYSSNCCHHFWPGLIANTSFSEYGHLLRLGVKNFTSLESQAPPLTCTMESFVGEEHSRLPLLFSQCQNFRMSCFSWQFCNLSVYLWRFGKSTTVLSPCCQAEGKVEDRMIFQCTLYCSLLCVLFLQSRTTWDIQLRSWKSHHCWYSEATNLSLFFSLSF